MEDDGGHLVGREEDVEGAHVQAHDAVDGKPESGLKEEDRDSTDEARDSVSHDREPVVDAMQVHEDGI
ncbi:hypothetical protein FIBSPDRAFT_880452 [Athelia psychrophila]|uniref:Uncharacterized protein n=1 Tax=Athelia psychrophila TaxID=1759441 RepID=A0A167SUW0_9AGAM|nr:hypothetical protein FIBSPDRAFT_880454 [Fibularhizoctonia sp. CBS 109695]KZP02270.1 hypothetical protein FIBSPDRAFT_880452 [Fibularhizoctonia sp. CBS 109695]